MSKHDVEVESSESGRGGLKPKGCRLVQEDMPLGAYNFIVTFNQYTKDKDEPKCAKVI